MSSSVWVSAPFRILLLILAVSLTLTLVFMGYNTENLSTFRISMLSQKSSTNCSNEKAERKTEDLLILIFMYPFGQRFDLNCDVYNITGCKLTDDKSMYPKADAVMVHHRDIKEADLPKGPRPSCQKWVWWNMESPTHSQRLQASNGLFNLTCNYRQDADIFTPYGSLVPVSNDEEPFTRIPTKDKLACWIVSNWGPHQKRVHYFNELKKHLEVKTYGSTFGQRISNEMYVEIMSSCKFYLAFENSVHTDYITEKFYEPLTLGTVPVVLGPPRENYELHAPGQSFIHVDDFASPKELAERLQYLDVHPDQYMDYFEWRNSFKVARTIKFGQEQACRTCQHLKIMNRYQTMRDLNNWWFNA